MSIMSHLFENLEISLNRQELEKEVRIFSKSNVRTVGI